MFKMKPLMAALSCLCVACATSAAEFAKEVSSTTVELQNAVVTTPSQAQAQGTLSAEQQARNWLQRANKMNGVNEVIKPDGTKEFNIIYTGVYTQAATKRTVSDVRAMGAMVAQLDAKAKLIKFLNTEISADVASTIPQRTPMATEYDKQLVAAEKAINALMEELELAMMELDQEKANMVGEISLDQLLTQGVAASLKARGITLDVDKAKAETAAKIEALQKRIVELDGKLKTLKKTQEEMIGSLKEERKSSVEFLSDMVVTGAVTVNSFESLINGQYQCAVVIVWSPAQERFIRSVMGLDRAEPKLKPTTGKTLNEYVNKIKWETVAGGRWIVDKDGVPHLFSVGAVEIDSDRTSVQNRARAMAEADARQNLALSLQSDVQTQTQAQRKVQTLTGKNDTDDVQSVTALASEMSASVKNLTVAGAQVVIDEQRVSPLTGRPLHVCVIEYSPLGHRKALDTFDAQKQTAVEAGRSQNEMKGFVNESKAQIEAARKDAEAYAHGQAAARGETMTQVAPAVQPATPAPVRPVADGKLGNSSFGGEGEEDFQF